MAARMFVLRVSYNMFSSYVAATDIMAGNPATPPTTSNATTQPETPDVGMVEPLLAVRNIASWTAHAWDLEPLRVISAACDQVEVLLAHLMANGDQLQVYRLTVLFDYLEDCYAAVALADLN
jgi:hypothetical protein